MQLELLCEIHHTAVFGTIH